MYFCVFFGIHKSYSQNSLVRLNLISGSNSDQTIINFNSGALDSYEAYDSKKMFNHLFAELYTVVDNKNLVINSLHAVSDEIIVPLYVNFVQAGSFSFVTVETTGNLLNYNILLKDNTTDSLHNLSVDGAYNFTNGIELSTNRFSLLFTEKYNNTSFSNSYVWTGTTNSDWNTASNWNKGAVPSESKNVTIPDVTNDPIIDQSSSTPAKCYFLIIESNATLTVNASKALTIQNQIINNGTFVLKSDITGTGTLLNFKTISGAGSFHSEQYITGNGGTTPNGRRWYLSSSTVGSTSNDVNAASTDKLFSYNEPTFNYSEINDNITNLTPTKGYVFRSGYNLTPTFTGTAYNTGTIIASNLSKTGTTNINSGYNLIGNPYPSYFDWEKAIVLNCSSTYTIKTVDPFGLPVNDTYNGLSHVGTANNRTVLTKYIAPHQAFWIEATDVSSGSITFSNNGRSHQSGKLKSDDLSILRIDLTNGISSDQLVLNFNENATSSYENYDSKKIFTNLISELYTQVEDSKLVINSFSEISNETIIPLNIQCIETGKYSLNLKEISGKFLNYSILLEDQLTGTLQDISSIPIYTFKAEKDQSMNRFYLYFKEKEFGNQTANIETKKENTARIFYSNQTINILLSETAQAEAIVYDVIGQKILTSSVEEGLNQIQMNEKSGIYIIEILSGSYHTIQKISIQ